MSEGVWFEGPVAEHYRNLLEGTGEEADRDAVERIEEVVTRARHQVALRDTLALGFGGLVGVLLSLLTVLVSHLHRRKRETPTARSRTQ